MTARIEGPEYEVLESGCWRWLLHAESRGYPCRRVDGHPRRMHRVYYERHVGPIPDGMEVEHRCRHKWCVNPAHLRLATGGQNRQNLDPGGYRNGSSRYRGVSWIARLQKWRATVRLDGKQHHLGCYADEDEAGRVAAAFRAEHMPFSEADRAA